MNYSSYCVLNISEFHNPVLPVEKWLKKSLIRIKLYKLLNSSFWRMVLFQSFRLSQQKIALQLPSPGVSKIHFKFIVKGITLLL